MHPQHKVATALSCNPYPLDTSVFFFSGRILRVVGHPAPYTFPLIPGLPSYRFLICDFLGAFIVTGLHEKLSVYIIVDLPHYDFQCMSPKILRKCSVPWEIELHYLWHNIHSISEFVLQLVVHLTFPLIHDFPYIFVSHQEFRPSAVAIQSLTTVFSAITHSRVNRHHEPY